MLLPALTLAAASALVPAVPGYTWRRVPSAPAPSAWHGPMPLGRSRTIGLNAKPSLYEQARSSLGVPSRSILTVAGYPSPRH